MKESSAAIQNKIVQQSADAVVQTYAKDGDAAAAKKLDELTRDVQPEVARQILKQSAAGIQKVLVEKSADAVAQTYAKEGAAAAAKKLDELTRADSVPAETAKLILEHHKALQTIESIAAEMNGGHLRLADQVQPRFKVFPLQPKLSSAPRRRSGRISHRFCPCKKFPSSQPGRMDVRHGRWRLPKGRGYWADDNVYKCNPSLG